MPVVQALVVREVKKSYAVGKKTQKTELITVLLPEKEIVGFAQFLDVINTEGFL